jgi:hypothetical protein
VFGNSLRKGWPRSFNDAGSYAPRTDFQPRAKDDVPVNTKM